MTNLDFLFNIVVNNSDFIPGTDKLLTVTTSLRLMLTE